eukprot:TRINITY_DN406_c0_g1_i1.p1 TRINITY_DN406_c0_g1~~TRINITY_DN406_c0_g1_i1.p1  ORF type:complete len:527 (+),score=94.33 TRINITY_DN406_c0_g1_i1:54-1583(+)
MCNRTLLALSIFILLLSSSSARDVDSIIKDLQKYCPYFGFDGRLLCPGSHTPVNQPKLNESFILSGLGYDRVTRQIRFPVLPSKTPVPSPSDSFETFSFDNVDNYLDYVYSEKSTYAAGLFILEDNFVKQFADLFIDYRIKMTNVQKLYNSYSTSVYSTSITIPEFTEILQTLPTVYNPKNATLVNLYQQRIIDLFGTDVSIQSTHGGIFYQQSVVKACYGGNVSSDMIKEIDATIAKVSPGALAYIDYRKLGVFDVKGGNPEIAPTQYAEIIASFPQYPAITGFDSVPLWQVVPAAYQAAVKAAIEQYTGENQLSVNSLIDQIEAARAQSYKNPQDVYVYARQTEQAGDSILFWNNCPYRKVGDGFYTPRCSYALQTASIDSGKNSVFFNSPAFDWHFLYETQRDATSGNMRIYEDVTPLDSADHTFKEASLFGSGTANTTISNLRDTILTSPWQHTGCVNLAFLYITGCPTCELYFSACIDCLPIVVTSPASFGMLNSDLQCVCPHF